MFTLSRARIATAALATFAASPALAVQPPVATSVPTPNLEGAPPMALPGLTPSSNAAPDAATTVAPGIEPTAAAEDMEIPMPTDSLRTQRQQGGPNWRRVQEQLQNTPLPTPAPVPAPAPATPNETPSNAFGANASLAVSRTEMPAAPTIDPDQDRHCIGNRSGQYQLCQREDPQALSVWNGQPAAPAADQGVVGVSGPNPPRR